MNGVLVPQMSKVEALISEAWMAWMLTFEIEWPRWMLCSGMKARVLSGTQNVRICGLYPINPDRLSNQCRTGADRCTPTLPR